MKPLSDFSGIDLVPGVVRGVRAFRVDDLGRLQAINYPTVWKPGENVAKCQATPGRHPIGDCSCGFYAFHDGSNDYHTTTGISAVVEGYGETVLGTRGFRSQKARIVALQLPPDPAVRKRWWLAQWFFDHPGAQPVIGGFSFALGVVATIGSVIFAVDQWSHLGPLVLFSFLVPGLFWTIFVTDFRADQESYSIRHDLLYRRGPDPEVVAKIRRNYPEIPVFDTVKEMVAAFPPDEGVEPSPESDPHFWDR